jgi:hypothetical protein
MLGLYFHNESLPHPLKWDSELLTWKMTSLFSLPISNSFTLIRVEACLLDIGSFFISVASISSATENHIHTFGFRTSNFYAFVGTLAIRNVPPVVVSACPSAPTVGGMSNHRLKW